MAWRYPNSVISHRSAIELRPTENGHFYLTSSFSRRVTDLPGITVNIYKGHPPHSNDAPYNGLYIASEYRYILENLQLSRRNIDGEEKTLPQSAIEERLERMILLGGEKQLNEFRDKTREVAKDLEMQLEFEKLTNIISALLNTHSSGILESEKAKARATGSPFDKDRIELFELLFDNLKDRFFIERPDRKPGVFKDVNNQAGNTVFVDYQLVEGTLRYGFRYFQLLREPLAKAVYMMFMISEVHPFIDGNGRIARIMMNAELVKGEQSRIIIPTVFREDYLLALRKLSRKKEPDTYIRVMEKLHHFSDNLYGQDFDELNSYLQSTNAYEEPTEGKLKLIDRTISLKSSFPNNYNL